MKMSTTAADVIDDAADGVENMVDDVTGSNNTTGNNAATGSNMSTRGTTGRR